MCIINNVDIVNHISISYKTYVSMCILYRFYIPQQCHYYKLLTINKCLPIIVEKGCPQMDPCGEFGDCVLMAIGVTCKCKEGRIGRFCNR